VAVVKKRTNAPTKPKAPARKNWTSFSEDRYRKVIGETVHFSAKTSNSNAPACGVRLANGARIDLPYVAVSTCDTQDIPLDYSGDATRGTVLSQLNAVIRGDEALTDRFEAVLAQEVVQIRQFTECAKSARYEEGTGFVSKRLRQIIVQDQHGNDVVLTPLQSAGFSRMLAERLDQERERLGEGERRRRRGVLGIGGANPQNVGAHVRAMGRPLVFRAPVEDMDVRRALAIHYRGIALRIPRALMVGYHEWRGALMRSHGERMPSDSELREHEQQWVRQVLGIITEQAGRASALLRQHVESLPAGRLVSAMVPAVIRGLLDRDERVAGWRRDFALHLRGVIIGTAFSYHGKNVYLGVGQQTTASWVGFIEEAL
jgi:hypothetical protein